MNKQLLIDFHAISPEIQNKFGVMSTVQYFDIFNYPLTEEEIYRFCHFINLTQDEVSSAIQELKSKGLLFEEDGFIIPRKNSTAVENRIKGNKRAIDSWSKAKKFSRRIAKFPYVRGVFISGSLSKEFMDEESDIDYFIITEPGRLWTCRFLLALYKKAFLLNSHKYFCINYFVDLNNLEISDKNIFTATELMFVVPMNNKTVDSLLRMSNSWAEQFYPGFQKKNATFRDEHYSSEKIKNSFEWLFNNGIGTLLEKQFKKINVGFWKKKFRKMPEKQFKQDLKSEDGLSKHHPNGLRDKILEEYQRRMAATFRQLDPKSQFEPSVKI